MGDIMRSRISATAPRAKSKLTSPLPKRSDAPGGQSLREAPDFLGIDLEELVASVHAKCALYVAGRRACGASDYEILVEISAGKLRTVLSEDEREAIVYWETLKEILRKDILRGHTPNKKDANSHR
jgi:hypothetical protein